MKVKELQLNFNVKLELKYQKREMSLKTIKFHGLLRLIFFSRLMAQPIY